MYTEHWTLILGIILLVLIFFLPEGVFGFVVKLANGSGTAVPAGEK
jgi:branched-chain amino acid transport system permease protein